MDDVEKVKSKLDIVDVIGAHLQLKKAGRNFKTNCPFHGEKTASFVVSPERQIWHCFGCHRGGDIFTFVQDYENITFAESLKELANRAGVKLTVSPVRSDKEKKRDLIYSLNHLSSQFYNYLLMSHPVGKRALEYLINTRKLTIPLIKTFMLGYAPGNDALVKYLIGKKRYKEEDLLLAGLAFQRGRYVSDFFRERIIFPIIDHRGNTIAFSGRGLTADGPPAGGPKYVNTKETPVYVKGDTLFGINLAKDAIKKEQKVIIVEGEFDVITAHKEGILNIVAVKGTALTENQIKLLKRFTQRFAFCFDTDPAGNEAQKRSIKMIDAEGITATIITQPEGKDPDEILNENPFAFKKAIKNDKNVYDFIIDSALAESDPSSVDGKKKILSSTLSYLSTIENQVIREHYTKKLAEALGSSIESVTSEIEKLSKPAQTVPAATPAVQLPREEILEIYLLSLIFQSKTPKKSLEAARKILSGIPLATPSLEKVLTHLENYKTDGTFSPSDFAAQLPSQLHVPFDTAYLSPISEFSDDALFSKELEKTARQVKLFSVKKRLNQLSELLKEAENKKENDKVTAYQEEFDKYTKFLSN